jgi:hypothetical protein
LAGWFWYHTRRIRRRYVHRVLFLCLRRSWGKDNGQTENIDFTQKFPTFIIIIIISFFTAWAAFSHFLVECTFRVCVRLVFESRVERVFGVVHDGKKLLFFGDAQRKGRRV